MVAGDLRQRAFREHRVIEFVDIEAGLNVLVAMLDQQPLGSLAAGTARFYMRKHKAAVQLFAMEIELEVALFEHLVGIAAHRFPCAQVPDHDSSCAVVAFGDGAFEIEVGNGMILHLHGETFVSGIERRALGNGPRFQHAIHFQSKVIVKASCPVLLNYKAMACSFGEFACRFRSAVELAFAFVFFESHRKKVAKSVAAVASMRIGALLCYSASFVILPDEKPTMLTVRIRSTVLASLLLISAQVLFAQQAKQPAAPATTAFTPEVAVKLMDQLLQGLQTQNPNQFLAAFDPEFMTNYGEFANQIIVLFTQYESFVGRYHVRQMGNDPDRPLVLVQFDLQGDPGITGAPLRKSAQVRFEFARGKNGWRIVNLTPRGFFS